MCFLQFICCTKVSKRTSWVWWSWLFCKLLSRHNIERILSSSPRQTTELNIWQFLSSNILWQNFLIWEISLLQYIEVQGEPTLCKRSICPIYTCQGKSTDAEGWKLDYVKSIQPLAIRYLEKLKLSQESLSDEVSLFQQLLKFYSFYRFLCMGWRCFEYKIIGKCLAMIIMLVVVQV